jgi:hypothetical protein
MNSRLTEAVLFMTCFRDSFQCRHTWTHMYYYVVTSLPYNYIRSSSPPYSITVALLLPPQTLL